MEIESEKQSVYLETADIETANDDYAGRFAGKAGAWLLDVQAECLRNALQGISPGMTSVDVGGGHGQTGPILVERGLSVTVTGSAPSCQKRLPVDMPFLVADHLNLPFEDRSVDVVVCFRLLTHCQRWPLLIKELCRISANRVIIDYPTGQSVNFLANVFFGLKKNVEKNTRTFTLFSHREIRETFAMHGFLVRRHPQFFWPMVLHRMLKNRQVSRFIETPPHWLGLTRLFGSPVVLEASRS